MDEKTKELTTQQINLMASVVTNEEIQRMFDEAREYYTHWSEPSCFSERITKFDIYKIFMQAWDVNHEYRHSSKVVFITEFGEFL